MVSSCWTNLPGSNLWTRIRFTKTSLGKHPSAVSSARHDLCAMTLFRSCCPFLWKHSTQEQTLLTGAEAIIPHIAMWGFIFLFDIRRPPPSASRRPLYQLLFPLLEIQAPHDKNWYYTDQVYVTWVATNAMKLPYHCTSAVNGMHPALMHVQTRHQSLLRSLHPSKCWKLWVAKR